MATIPPLRVLLFDVFGTCVAQRSPVADALSEAAKAALQSDTASISDTVKANAAKMTSDDWFDFGGEWNKAIDALVANDIKTNNSVDWKLVDKYRLQTLIQLLTERGLIDSPESPFKAGSLWTESQLNHLSLVWHRLPPWPDTCHGIKLLNKRYATVTLSNAYNMLIRKLVAHGNILFTETYSSDMFQSFKPKSEVYLGAAEKMGVKPAECALVAAHLGDLKAAKACGFFAIYVERPLEEKSPRLREESIPDLVIEESQNGFIALAEKLGIPDDE